MPARNRHERGEPRALRPQWLFRHLDDNFLVALELLLDRQAGPANITATPTTTVQVGRLSFARFVFLSLVFIESRIDHAVGVEPVRQRHIVAFKSRLSLD